MKAVAAASIAALVLAVDIVSAAQTETGYPNRPIRMISPSSAGGPADVIARAVSQGISDVLGQQVVIDNRAGAAGLIGPELVGGSTPDGYTLMFGFSGPLAIAPHIAPKPPYDIRRDFAAV